jgi:hypothetical protein
MPDNKIEIPQYNLQVQELTRAIRCTDETGSEFNIMFLKEGGVKINKIGKENSQIAILPGLAPNEVIIK